MIHRLIRLSLAIVIHPQYTEGRFLNSSLFTGNNTEVVKPGIISGNFISLEGLLLLRSGLVLPDDLPDAAKVMLCGVGDCQL